mmetsp:Transcript_90459/g.292800  ORF Transcript_90459/g.292800 Transcript_90459/m.292800 type:complete len:199 (+) Transcript_90459:196-792(+)
MSLPALAAVIDLEYVPWGNAYFVTEKCKGAGGYELLSRRCYDTVCGAEAVSRPPDCFKGELICQNGEGECKADRYAACAKQKAGKVASKYMPYVVCIDKPFQGGPSPSGLDITALAASCASSTGLGALSAAIENCVATAEGDGVVQAEAMATPSHGFCPYVTIDGQELPDKDQFLSAICAAHPGAPLAGCPAPGSQFV